MSWGGFERYGEKPRKSLYSNKEVNYHVWVWENYYKKRVPKGYVIHHKDGNPKNNDISNLECMTTEEHKRYHGSNITEEKRSELRKKYCGNGNPFFGKKHSIETIEKLKKIHTGKKTNIPVVECPYCGKKGKKNLMHRYHFENCKER